MRIVVVLALFITLAILGPWLGADSRVTGGWTPTDPAKLWPDRRTPGPDRRGRPAAPAQPARLLSTEELSILRTPPSRTSRYSVRSTDTVPSVK